MIFPVFPIRHRLITPQMIDEANYCLEIDDPFFLTHHHNNHVFFIRSYTLLLLISTWNYSRLSQTNDESETARALQNTPTKYRYPTLVPKFDVSMWEPASVHLADNEDVCAICSPDIE